MTDLKRFEYVLALAECMNFSQAAAKLNISQSSLSQYIQKIEKEIGVSLFDRTSSHLRLTQYGEIYIKGARRILDVYCEVLDSISDADLGTSGTVKVGISPSRAPFLLPGVVENFRKSYPDVTLNFIESKSKEIIKNLIDGNIDFAFTVSSGIQDQSDFSVIPVEDEEIMLVSSKSFNLPSKLKGDAIDFKSVSGMKFVVLEDDQLLTNDFYKLCRESTATADISISVSELSTAIALVEKGLGIMLLPSSYRGYGNLSQNLDFLSVSEFTSKRQLCIMYRKDKYINRPMKALMEIMSKDK